MDVAPRVRGHVCAILEGRPERSEGLPGLTAGSRGRRLIAAASLSSSSSSWLVGSKVDIASRGSGEGSRRYQGALFTVCKQTVNNSSLTSPRQCGMPSPSRGKAESGLAPRQLQAYHIGRPQRLCAYCTRQFNRIATIQ